MTKILIVGASLAGPALAFWLLRAGFEVDLAEAAPALRQGGNGVDVRGEAAEVVERMGLLDAVRARGLSSQGFIFAGGRRPVTVDLKKLQGQSGYVDIELPRGDMAQILFDTTRHDASYRFGARIGKIEDTGDAVVVGFADGSEARCDLVIGADGLHSSVRRIVFGDAPGMTEFRGHYFAFGSTGSRLANGNWITFYNRPGQSVALARKADGFDQVHFMFRAGEAIAYDHRDMEAQRQIVRQAFFDRTWFPPELMAAVEADDFYFDSISQVKLPAWSKGRVALVGDAAYCASPASGAGALLALVGAYRLAGALASHPGDHLAAFAAYEAAQRPLVASKQKQLFTGISVPSTRLGIGLRNLVLGSPLAAVLTNLAPTRIEPVETYAALAASR